MRNVSNNIDITGGLAALKSRPIRLEVPGFMRLVVEHVGAALPEDRRPKLGLTNPRSHEISPTCSRSTDCETPSPSGRRSAWTGY
jgi:hypothetical protein